MALVTSTAALAATTAAAAYIDAKLNLTSDLTALWGLKKVEREYARNVKDNRQSLWYFFEEPVRDYPNHEAIWSRLGIYTFQETYNAALQYAQYFEELGVQPGDLVAFYLQNAPEFVFAWLGLWAIGAAPAMINFNLGGDALIHCLKISGARLLLADDDAECRGRIEKESERVTGELGMRIEVLNDQLKQVISRREAQRPGDSYRSNVKGDDPAAFGTTGLPKAAPFTISRLHLGAADRSSMCNQKRGPGGDKWYNCMPFYHGTGGYRAMVNIMSGVSLAIGRSFSVSRFWPDVRDSQSNFIVYVGETARYLLAAPPSSLDKEHKVRCMYGNGLRPDVWLRFRERFNIPEVAEFFSSSEGMLDLFIWNRGPYTADCVGHHGFLIRAILHNIFVPVAIDTETNDIVRDPITGLAIRNSYDQGGEIIVKIPNEKAFAGYWNNPQATKKKFVQDVFKTGDLYYRSGDALRRTDDGRWFFQDRLGDTYRWKSENVSTAEVAEVIGRFPGVFEANVYGVSVPSHEGRAGCAALSIAPEHKNKLDWMALAAWARDRLPKYAVPVFMRVVEAEVGATASHNQKQDKSRLRAEGVEPSLRGTKVMGGGGDSVFWLQGEGYVPFGEMDWRGLVAGRVRL